MVSKIDIIKFIEKTNSTLSIHYTNQIYYESSNVPSLNRVSSSLLKNSPFILYLISYFWIVQNGRGLVICDA